MKRLIFGLILGLMSVSSFATDVSLAWDQSTSPNLIGNRVYWGTQPNVYPNSQAIPAQTTYTVTGLNSGTYYFAVTARTSDAESGFSNEVSTTITQTYSRCDLNKDSSINILDVQLLTNSILNKSGGVDLNRDGSVNVLDLQILTNSVLGTSQCPE